MSEQKPPTKVPDGLTRFYTTRQMAKNEKGFVGYETVWKPLQKEVSAKNAEKALSAVPQHEPRIAAGMRSR